MNRQIDQGENSGNWVTAHPVITFYVIAFGVSWAGFYPMLAASSGISFFQSPLWSASLILPGCGPAIAAAATVRLTGERGNPLLRLRASLRWRVHPGWYLAALLAPLTLLLAAQLVSRILLPGEAPALAPQRPDAVLTLTWMSLLANPWEEVGWRGFAFHRLQMRISPLLAAVVVGVFWGWWHIPLFLWTGSPMSTFSFWPWFISLVAESCLVGWLYNSADHSLVIAMLFHVA
ncbi:MAG: CPBP family intramembrane metalloprotease, partial [Bryobacteraceae bacterium]|nr:CPBP family intramembrane metalloprotease [Bryobacteraceae bacterium]